MSNIKAKTYLIASMIALSSQSVIALDQKASPAVNATTQKLDHQQILTHLMLAELALQRNMPQLALENYMLVVNATHDPDVAQLATELAVQLQSPNEALNAAEVWAQAAPTDLQAQLVAVSLYVNNDPRKTILFLDHAFAIKNNDIDQHLLVIMSKLSPAGQKNLTTAVNTVAAQRKNDAYANLSAAQISAVQLDVDTAGTYLNTTLKIKPDLTSAIELNAKLIRHKHNADAPALAYLDKQVAQYPKNAELRMFYISALIDNNQTAKALPHLEILSKDATYGGEALINLGEIYITQQKYSQAETVLKKALAFTSAADKANYYLAQLAEYKNKTSEAIKFYESVSENSEYNVPAFLRAAYLYSMAGDYDKALSTLQNSSPNTFFDQKQILLSEIDVMMESRDYEQALDNCNNALGILPEDVDFLYARSMIFGLMNKSLDAEKDLRAIIKLEPNNANALNALGFTLANQPSRIKEALPLLEKALSINPENPAFMDSMGWLLYRMGKNQESIEILSKAYKLSGDNEIAAHYGEVLWFSGKKEAAKDIWSKALAASPLNQQAIHDTLNRLQIPLSDLSSTATPMKKTSKINR